MNHYSLEQLMWAKVKAPCIIPSRAKAATAIALGLWEPANHDPGTTFTLMPTFIHGNDENTRHTLTTSIGSPPHLASPPGLKPVPGFVNVQLGNGGTTNGKPPKLYPINSNLFSQYCGQFNNRAKKKDASTTFQLLPPENGSLGINEDALSLIWPVFSNWVHGGELVTGDGTLARRLSLVTLCRLYVFGMILESPLFSNAVIDTIKQKKQNFRTYVYSGIEEAVMYVYGFPYIPLRNAVVEFVIVNSGAWILDAFEWPSIAKKDMLDALFTGCKENALAALINDKRRHHVRSYGSDYT